LKKYLDEVDCTKALTELVSKQGLSKQFGQRESYGVRGHALFPFACLSLAPDNPAGLRAERTVIGTGNAAAPRIDQDDTGNRSLANRGMYLSGNNFLKIRKELPVFSSVPLGLKPQMQNGPPKNAR
jgi:hypothetical protein